MQTLAAACERGRRVDMEGQAGRKVEAPDVLERISLAKQQWESTVDSLPDLVLLVGPDRRVIRANRTIETWALGSVIDVPGRDLHEVLHRDCVEAVCEVVELWRRLRASNGRTESMASEFLDPLLARRIDLSMHCPGQRREDAPTTVVVRDCSENYEREEFRRRKDRLDTMEYVLGGLAHEVGNPIAAMKTTIDVWRRSFDRFDRDTHERYLARVEEGLDRLRASVDRVLGAEGKRAPRRDPVSIQALLERVHSLFLDQATEAGTRLALDLRLGADDAVLGDPAALDEIVANLVKNALEASGSGARVCVRAEIQGSSIVVQVEDTGTGIGPHDMDRLFVPFYTTKPTGTGLGLTLANQLTQQMGGRIEIESSEGRGTIATLRLPRAEPGATTP